MYVHVLFLSLSQFTVLHHSRVTCIGSSSPPHLSYVILPLLSKPCLPLPSLVATARQEAVARRLLVMPTLCYCFMELYKSEGKRLLIFFLPFLSVLFACIFPTFFLLLPFFLFPFLISLPPSLPPSPPPSVPPFLSRSVFGSLHVEGVWGYFTDTEGPVCGLPS